MANPNSKSFMKVLTLVLVVIFIIIISLLIILKNGNGRPGWPQGAQCQLQDGFSCLTWSMNENGILTLNVLQATPDPINVSSVSCNTNSTNTNYATSLTPQVFLSVDSNAIIRVQCYAGNIKLSGQPQSTFDVYLQLNYIDITTYTSKTVTGNAYVRVN
jgi:hypothetical protein